VLQRGGLDRVVDHISAPLSMLDVLRGGASIPGGTARPHGQATSIFIVVQAK
jgi:hypothetical protein